jgi:hypothetical protein
MDRFGLSSIISRVSVCVLLSTFVAAAVAPIALAGDNKEATLSFAMPENTTLTYKATLTNERNFMGMDIMYTQSADVDVSLGERLESGSSKVVFIFKKLKASQMVDGELEATDPQIDLDGKTVRADVAPTGEVSNVEAGSYIPGMQSIKQLEQIISYWFVYLPDTLVAVGDTWTQEHIEPGKKEGDPPLFEGAVEFKLKKIEEKKGMLVAEIEGKGRGAIKQSTGFGMLDATVKIELKAKVAVDGGYTIESKLQYDTKGKLRQQDSPTAEVKESDVADTRYFECKLQR